MAIATEVPRIIRNAGRLQQVVRVLVRYRIAPWLRHVPIAWIQGLFRTNDGVAILDLTGPERIRAAISEVGTTFIKLGQILSTRPDVVGTEVAEQLAKLQSQTTPDSSESVRQTIEAELGKPVDELFDHFEEAPLASASIGQVHQATLHDGTQVVVKVLHEGIEDQIRNDLEIAAELAALAELYSDELKLYRPVETVAELGRTLKDETDFRRELQNLQAFAHHFRNDKTVRFPKAYPEFSSARVLTMEHLSGEHVSSTVDIRKAGFDPTSVAENGANAFLNMLFRDGFIHADPHPGNLLLLEDGRIGIIDCGMVGRLDDRVREQLENMLLAAADGDVEFLVDMIEALGELPSNFDRERLARDVADFFDRYASLPLDEIDVSEVMNESIAAIRRHHIRLPARISMLVRMLAVLEGTAKSICPDFRLMKAIQSFRSMIIRRRCSPSRLRRKASRTVRHWSHLLDIVPTDVADILDRIKQGSFDVHLEHRRLDVIANRLVQGIIAASLFIGSSLLWSRNVLPEISGYSVPGCLGFAVATYLTIQLLRAIRSSGSI